jgi:uncharacterized membrane protein YedE/YeeE
MDNFTPWSSLAGGVLIGLAASLLWLGAGRIAGVSGILQGFAFREPSERAWRGAFLLGLLLAGLVLGLVLPEKIGLSPRSLGYVLLAGITVGAGSYFGSGCTSGHGVCGVGRVSARSLVATTTFIATGMLTVALLRAFGVAS